VVSNACDPGFTPEVNAMLAALLPGVEAALTDNLVGVYLRGSLALGDFDPATSDIDFLVVTERPVAEAEFAALAVLHARLAALPNKYADHLEGSYIPRAAVERFRPDERRHPTVGADWTFQYGEHRDGWILERWTVRERGVILRGPDPKTLIDPITPDAICQAVRVCLREWTEWMARPDGLQFVTPRSHQAFAAETMCRALYTLAHSRGALPTKPRAVAWARETLPEPWRSLVEQSRTWRTDTTPNPASMPTILRFVRWAAAEGGATASSSDQHDER